MLKADYVRAALPFVFAAVGAVLYAVSPMSHQAFCSPFLPVIVSPEGPATVPGA